MKKNRPSPPPPLAARRPFLILAVLLLLVSASSCTRHALPYRHSHSSCDSLVQQQPRSLCFHIQSIHRHRPLLPLPPPPPPDNEIDPRYGVEKRLVPSGPNPLHN
ncbi:CLAVATA3/ESR (CLE)-related protein 10-like [Punica granatum]|uniref:CLAVATA3/ESR (CLE)-related protein 10-like n=1 Tax=Punica granatum TaxID=22663 RepID=A0A218XYC6_PUNGR|nr:CLAVATA3/ESR (CLE)-related protein 10-like [Punica granatum]OWM89491.1 hypothetical protein CDL15_Pgr024239 [Punica granatum]